MISASSSSLVQLAKSPETPQQQQQEKEQRVEEKKEKVRKGYLCQLENENVAVSGPRRTEDGRLAAHHGSTSGIRSQKRGRFRRCGSDPERSPVFFHRAET